MNSKIKSKKLYPIYYFFLSYPLRSSFAVIALLMSGLAEGFSFAALIPLISVALQSENSVEDQSFLERIVGEVFSIIGLEGTVGNILLFIVIFMFFKSALAFYAMKEVGYISVNVEADFRRKLADSLLHAKWAYYLKNKTGDFSSAISTQAEKAINVFIATSTVSAGVIQIAIYSAMSFTISIPVTIGAFLLGFAVMFGLSRFVTLARVSSEGIATRQATLLSTLIDGLRGIKANKAMGMQGNLLDYLNSDISLLAVLKKRVVLSSSALANFQEPIQIIAISAALFFLTSYWDGGIEQLLVLILLFYRTGQRLATSQAYVQQIVSSIPSFWFVSNIITSSEAEREELQTGQKAVMGRSIKVDEVSFSYDQKNVLNEISVEITSGEFVTIVGPSGSGKTTLTDIFLQFYEPDSGAIYFDDININSFSKSSLRKIIGYVPQETILFHDTIKNNITFSDGTISDEQIEVALEKAGLLDVVRQLPGGLDYVVGEHGGRLSGGQKQRIGLARALLTGPAILLLDEPTSALDRTSEKAILETLKKLQGVVTIIAISHQQTFVDAADRELSLDHGKITEINRHPDAM